MGRAKSNGSYPSHPQRAAGRTSSEEGGSQSGQLEHGVAVGIGHWAEGHSLTLPTAIVTRSLHYIGPEGQIA